jgi:hypothetical protein
METLNHDSVPAKIELGASYLSHLAKFMKLYNEMLFNM